MDTAKGTLQNTCPSTPTSTAAMAWDLSLKIPVNIVIITVVPDTKMTTARQATVHLTAFTTAAQPLALTSLAVW